MAFLLSPSSPITPLRRSQPDHASESQSTPTPLQPRIGKTLRWELPKLRNAPRPTLRKGVRSAPDSTPNAGADGSNDLTRTPESQKKKVPSPCGKKEYVLQSRLKKHTDTCEQCLAINKKEKTQAQGIYETASGLQRHPPPKLAEYYANKIVDKQIGERGGANVQKDCEAPGKFELGHAQVPLLHGANDSTYSDHELQPSNDENCGRIYVPVMTNKKSITRNPRNADKQPEKSDGKDGPTKIDAMVLGLEDEAHPEGALLTKSAGPKAKATEIHDKLRTTLEMDLTPHDVEGCIYIFFDPKRPELHKIGRSKRTQGRKGDLEYKCGLSLDTVKITPVHFYCRTERLIHSYLLDLRRTYVCEVCGANHGEWFEISNESAREAVTLWTKFMNQENPYDLETRQLQPFTRDLVKRQDLLFANADSKIETTREHWNRILSPTSLDRFGIKFNVLWYSFWKFYWPINTMFAWTVAFVVSRHPVTFMFLAASVIGTLSSMSDDHHRLRYSLMKPKKKAV